MGRAGGAIDRGAETDRAIIDTFDSPKLFEEQVTNRLREELNRTPILELKDENSRLTKRVASDGKGATMAEVYSYHSNGLLKTMSRSLVMPDGKGGKSAMTDAFVFSADAQLLFAKHEERDGSRRFESKTKYDRSNPYDIVRELTDNGKILLQDKISRSPNGGAWHREKIETWRRFDERGKLLEDGTNSLKAEGRLKNKQTIESSNLMSSASKEHRLDTQKQGVVVETSMLSNFGIVHHAETSKFDNHRAVIKKSVAVPALNAQILHDVEITGWSANEKPRNN